MSGGGEKVEFLELRVSSVKKIEELITVALKGFIGLDDDTKDLVVAPLFTHCKMNIEDKLLIGLLGYKALEMLGWRESDYVTAKELSLKLGINYSSVRFGLSKLAKEGLVKKRRKGQYSINITFIEEISNRLIKLKEKCQGSEKQW